jgi:hypothetical protein
LRIASIIDVSTSRLVLVQRTLISLMCCPLVVDFVVVFIKSSRMCPVVLFLDHQDHIRECIARGLWNTVVCSEETEKSEWRTMNSSNVSQTWERRVRSAIERGGSSPRSSFARPISRRRRARPASASLPTPSRPHRHHGTRTWLAAEGCALLPLQWPVGHGLWLLAETGQDVRRHRVRRVHCAMRPQSDQRWVVPFVPLCILLWALRSELT